MMQLLERHTPRDRMINWHLVHVPVPGRVLQGELASRESIAAVFRGHGEGRTQVSHSTGPGFTSWFHGPRTDASEVFLNLSKAQFADP